MTRESGGFTLTEMLVVLALISMVALVATPYVRFGKRDRNPDAVARDIANVLADARIEAMKAGKNVRVDIVANGQGPMIKIDGNALFVVPDGYAIKAEGVGRSSLGETVAIVFLPSGESTGGIVDLMHGAETRRITVDWLNGHVDAGALKQLP